MQTLVLDQFRVLVVAGTGGGMNMIDTLAKEGRIVTHGINFDVNKATLRPVLSLQPPVPSLQPLAPVSQPPDPAPGPQPPLTA
jgi:hypothetical protein